MDEFYVIVYETNLINIPVEKRADWIRKLYPSVNILIAKNPPLKYGLDEESVKIQTDYLKNILGDICVTHFFSSEKYGKFVACSGYPECKYVPKEEKEETIICKCPKCDGNIIIRKTKRGKEFYGCSNYPKCKNAFWDKPTGEICSKCGNLMVEKKGEKICPNCKG